MLQSLDNAIIMDEVLIDYSAHHKVKKPGPNKSEGGKSGQRKNHGCKDGGKPKISNEKREKALSTSMLGFMP